MIWIALLELATVGSHATPLAAGEPASPREIGPATVVLAGPTYPTYHPSPDRLVIEDGAGGWWIATTGPDSGARVIRLDGSLRPRPGFAGLGRPLYPAEGYVGWPSQLLADGAGGVYALWENGYSIHTRRLQSDGDFVPGWENADLHWAFSPGYRSESPNAVAIADRGILLTQTRTPQQPPYFSRISLTNQYFDEDGGSPFQWDPVYARGMVDAPAASLVEACTDGADGAYVAWTERDSLGDSLTVRLIRIRPTSVPSPGWSPRGTVVARHTLVNSFGNRSHRLCPDGSGGVIVTWALDASGTYVQRFLGDSLPRWGEGGRPITLTRSEDVRIAQSGPESWFVTWSESYQKRIVRIDGSGGYATGWTSPLDFGGTDWSFGAAPWIAADGSGGVYLAQMSDWGMLPSARVLRILRLTESGTAATGWDPAGLVLHGVRATQQHAQVARSPAGLLLLWTESSSWEAGPLMGLLVSPDGAAIDPDDLLPKPLAILAASPNPMRDDLAIRLRSGVAQRLDVEVFDLQGRSVRVVERGLVLPSGDHTLHWDGRDASGARVRPGVYLVHASSTAGLVTRRIVAGL